MSFISVDQAKITAWRHIPQGVEVQRDADSLSPLDRLDTLKKIANLRSVNIFNVSKPFLLIDPSIKSLEDAREGVRCLLEALCAKNPAKVRAQFALLPQKLQSTLMWAIWFHDVLEGRPIRGANHGELAFTDNPLILSSYFLPILHVSGGCLARQLHHYENEHLMLRYQEITVSRFTSGLTDQQRLDKMKLSWSLSQLEQYRVLDGLFKSPEQREFFFRRLSPLTQEWIHRTVIKPKSANLLYNKLGAQYEDNMTLFSVYAPFAKKMQCELIGLFDRCIDMERQPDGTWWAVTCNAPPGTSYLYKVETNKGDLFDKVDPFSFSIAYSYKGRGLCSVVVDRNAFLWSDHLWCQKRSETNPLEKPLSIYELHIKSWDKDQRMDLRSIAPKIASYCKEMGFTHIELYGMMEHFWPRAVSYQVTNYFSPHHECGSYEDMKFFVNYMHAEGVGVIIDWIPCHFDHGPSSGDHFRSSIHWFDGTDLFSDSHSMWGTLYFDHGKAATQDLLEASALWWINEFHVDGLRVDAVSQMIRRDGKEVNSGVDFLRSLNEKVHAQHPGVLMIAEATDWDPRMCKPSKEGGIGFDVNWSCGASGDMRNYLKTPLSERSQLEHHNGKLEKVFEEGKRAHEKKIFSHSHDDTDAGDHHDKTLFHIADAYSRDNFAKYADVRNFLSFQIFGPSWGHLIHMGDELGQKQAWAARFNRGQCSVDWDCLSDAGHRGIKEFVKDSIHYYKEKSDFWRRGGELADLFYSYRHNNVIAYSRGSHVIIHNFSHREFPRYDIELPADFSDAKMRERINSNEVKYGGSGSFLNRHLSMIETHGKDRRTLTVSLASRASVLLEKI